MLGAAALPYSGGGNSTGKLGRRNNERGFGEFAELEAVCSDRSAHDDVVNADGRVAGSGDAVGSLVPVDVTECGRHRRRPRKNLGSGLPGGRIAKDQKDCPLVAASRARVHRLPLLSKIGRLATGTRVSADCSPGHVSGPGARRARQRLRVNDHVDRTEVLKEDPLAGLR